MSLTSQINNKTSFVSLYFAEFFPNLKQFCKQESKILENCNTVLPANEQNYDWMGVGHIVEYLFFIQPSIGLDIKRLPPFPFCTTSIKKDIVYFFENFDFNLIKKPLNKNQADIKKAFNYLYYLGQLESHIRSGLSDCALNAKNINQNMIDDLIAIYGHLENNNFSKQDEVLVYNPHFSLAKLVGGADGDFIYHINSLNTLYEIKTTKMLSFSESYFKQLLGYVFLDEHKILGINNVGLYFPRQNIDIHWTLEELIQKTSNFQTTKQAKEVFIQKCIAHYQKSNHI